MSQSDLSAFHVYWHDESHTILVVVFAATWTMDEVYPVLDRIEGMLEEDLPKQALVFDLTGTQLPPDAAKHFRRLLAVSLARHPAVEMSIVVTGDSRPLEVTIAIYERLYKLIYNRPVVAVPTLSAAWETIARIRAGD